MDMNVYGVQVYRSNNDILNGIWMLNVGCMHCKHATRNKNEWISIDRREN